MQKSYFFIVNPNANGGRAKKNWRTLILPRIKEKIQDFDWAETEKQGHAAQLATQAKRLGHGIVVAVGGDGTIHEVVNGLLALTSEPTPVLGCLPAGTGCDFVKSLGISKHILGALDTLLQQKTILSDVGKITYNCALGNDSCYFINIASCGSSGQIIQQINLSKKPFKGSLLFAFHALKNIFENVSYPVLVSLDDQPFFPVDLRNLFVCNGQFCAGGMRIGSSAKLNDGFFSVYLMEKASVANSIQILPKLYSGNFSGLSFVRQHHNIKKITVVANEKHHSPVFIECDGEQPGFLPATFSFAQQKLAVIVD